MASRSLLKRRNSKDREKTHDVIVWDKMKLNVAKAACFLLIN